MSLKTAVALVGTLVGSLLVSQPLWAQTGASPPTTAGGGAFQSLSPGNQKIADALFAAQKPSDTTVALSKDQIATMKEGAGWGNVFRQMKSDGLLSAKNLGQVVSAHEHALHSALTTSATGRGTATAGASRGGTNSAHGGHSGTMVSGARSHGYSHMASRRNGNGYVHGGYAGNYGHGGYGGPGFAPYGHGGMGGGYPGGGFAGSRGGGFSGGHGH